MSEVGIAFISIVVMLAIYAALIGAYYYGYKDGFQEGTINSMENEFTKES